MSEACEVFKDMRDLHKAKRRLFGVPCPDCVRKLPKAHPAILLPQQRCRIHGYRDSRPHLTDEQFDEALRAAGFEPMERAP